MLKDQTETSPEPTSLLDPRFVWKRGADVQETWKKYGWKPTTEMERSKPKRFVEKVGETNEH